MNSKSTPTGVLIDKYIEIRGYIQAKQKELDEHLKVYKDGLIGIENEVLARLNADKAQSAKAQSGAIAFKQLNTYTRVTNRAEWIAWLATHWDVGQDMLTTHVSKDVIMQAVENGVTKIPDGIEITQIWGVNFRKG